MSSQRLTNRLWSAVGRQLLVAAVIAVVAPLAPAHACSFDTDCEVGSRCVKSRSSIYGICVGGMFPGNSYDRRPVYSPLDPNRTFGNTCSFSTDCGPGSVCAKGPGQLQGTCVRR
jgi:hypothetical protein